MSRKSLTPKQVLAIELILQGHSKSETSKEVKITPETLSRWMNNKLFFETLESKKKKLSDRLENLTFKTFADDFKHSFEVLRKLRNDSENKDVQHKACDTTLKHLSKLRELSILDGLSKRMDELEKED